MVERLTEKFSDLPAAVVEETVTEIHDSFDDAAVRDFVPRIVEHEATEKLREVEAEASTSDPTAAE
ncbi:three-helix bundle dimerization domain-containing protein [Microbacterium sp. CJ88]|uniref:three-helix bundle dimerization domain-containing protein n=1 Tax=Microbacterium sp. CJ88 TaxID=3445672 RepID=UPI003F654B83